jgi:uncharacterized cupredoxin-like copper-binding protein
LAMNRRWNLHLGTMLIVVGLAGGCATQHSAHPVQTVKTEPATIDVVLREFEYAPNPLKVTAGKVRFLLRNRGTVEHDFMIPGLMGHVDHAKHLVKPGQSRVVEVNLKPGVYEAVCTVSGHKEAGMRMTIEVGVEAGSPGEP